MPSVVTKISSWWQKLSFSKVKVAHRSLLCFHSFSIFFKKLRNKELTSGKGPQGCGLTSKLLKINNFLTNNFHQKVFIKSSGEAENSEYALKVIGEEYLWWKLFAAGGTCVCEEGICPDLCINAANSQHILIIWCWAELGGGTLATILDNGPWNRSWRIWTKKTNETGGGNIPWRSSVCQETWSLKPH